MTRTYPTNVFTDCFTVIFNTSMKLVRVYKTANSFQLIALNLECLNSQKNLTKSFSQKNISTSNAQHTILRCQRYPKTLQLMKLIKFILLWKCHVFVDFTVMYCMSVNFIFWNSTMTNRLPNLVSRVQKQEHTF